MSDPLTLRLERRLKARLDRLAKATDRSRAWLAAEAVRHYLELNEWQIAAIRAGVREADRGRLVSHERLRAKWERRLAAALDKDR
ncbi:MAG: CopG family ribbon-helix-helix protein [Burkholderiales bacterium]